MNQFHKHLSGQRTLLIKKIIKFLQSLENSPALQDSLSLLSKMICQNLDLNNEISNTTYIPIYKLSYQVLKLCNIDSQKNDIDVQRLSRYLAQAQFSFIFTKEESDHIFDIVSQINKEFVVQSQIFQEILDSIQLNKKKQISKDLICLNQQDYDESNNLYNQLLLSLPAEENFILIKNYVKLYLYYLSGQYQKSKVDERQLFLKVIQTSNLQVTRIILNQIEQNLQSNEYLNYIKGNPQNQQIKNIQIRLFQDQEIIQKLFEVSLIDKELYEDFLDLLIIPGAEINLSQYFLVIYSNKQICEKKSQKLIQLILQNDSSSEVQKIQFDIFSKDKQTRQQSQKILFQFSSIQTKFQREELKDAFLKIYDEDIQIYQDTFDLKWENPSTQQDLQIENISHLETIIIDPKTDFKIKLSALQQLVEILVIITKKEKDILKTWMIKQADFHQFIKCVSDNILKLCLNTFKLLNDNKIAIINLQLLGYCLDILLITKNKSNQLTDIALFVLCMAYDIQSVYSAYRYLYNQIFNNKNINHKNYYTLLNINQFNEGQQFWEKYQQSYKTNIQYINKYFKYSLVNSLKQQQEKEFKFIKQQDLVQNLDLILVFNKLNIGCTVDPDIQLQLKQTIISEEFLQSNQTYLISLVHKSAIAKEAIFLLSQQVYKLFQETETDDQVQYLYLYIQLLYVLQQKSDIHIQILRHLPKQQFNIKTANFIIQLIKSQMIDYNPELIWYLQKQLYQQNHALQFQNSYLLKELMSITKNQNYFSQLDQLDQQIIFSRLIQFTQHHITIIRQYAYQTIQGLFDIFNEEQLSRIHDNIIEQFYSFNEAVPVFIQIQTILLKLKPRLKSLKILNFIEETLNGSANQLVKAGQIKLMYFLMTTYKEEVIPQIQLNTLVKFIKNEDSHPFTILHSIMIISFISRQSVAKSLQLIQSYSLVELLTKYIAKAENILPEILCEISNLMQFIKHYHNDYLELENKRVTYNPINNIQNALQQNTGVDKKICISKMLVCFNHKPTEDLLHGLVSLYQESYDKKKDDQYLDILSVITYILGQSQLSKIIMTKTGISQKICNDVNAELDDILYEQQNAKSKMNESKVSFRMQESPQLKLNIIYLKQLFYATDEDLDLQILGPIIGETIKILQKLLFCYVKSQKVQFRDYVYQLTINMGSNLQLSSQITVKMQEQKWQYLLELQKLLKSDNIPLESKYIFTKILSVLGQLFEVRVVYLRNKLIEDYQEILIRLYDNKKKWNPSSQIVNQTVEFVCSISFYKDCQSRITQNTQFINILTYIISESDINSQCCQDILIILSNCALNGKTKKSLLANQKVAPIIISLITEQNFHIQTRLKGSQILLNLFYKCTQAVAMFNKPQILEAFEITKRESQRQIDRLLINNEQLTLQTEIEQQERNLRQTQELQNNIINLLNILNMEW
ncbi:hypothetical protein pb186bvf_014338 [Paramecium bursaria]